MDLIEILWKQDVDLGYSLDIPPAKSHKQNTNNNSETKKSPPPSAATPSSSVPEDDIEKLKTLEALNDNLFKVSAKSLAVFANNRFFEATK